MMLISHLLLQNKEFKLLNKPLKLLSKQHRLPNYLFLMLFWIF